MLHTFTKRCIKGYKIWKKEKGDANLTPKNNIKKKEMNVYIKKQYQIERVEIQRINNT